MTEREKTDAAHMGVEIVNSARRWTRLRARLRIALDSKTASPSQVEKIKVAYNKESYELEMLVVKLERTLLLSGQLVPATRRTSRPFPWQELFTLLAKAGAEGLHGALNGQDPPEQGRSGTQRHARPRRPSSDDDVIDAEIEES